MYICIYIFYSFICVYIYSYTILTQCLSQGGVLYALPVELRVDRCCDLDLSAFNVFNTDQVFSHQVYNVYIYIYIYVYIDYMYTCMYVDI